MIATNMEFERGQLSIQIEAWKYSSSKWSFSIRRNKPATMKFIFALFENNM